jgi:hypothetical protein
MWVLDGIATGRNSESDGHMGCIFNWKPTGERSGNCSICTVREVESWNKIYVYFWAHYYNNQWGLYKLDRMNLTWTRTCHTQCWPTPPKSMGVEHRPGHSYSCKYMNQYVNYVVLTWSILSCSSSCHIVVLAEAAGGCWSRGHTCVMRKKTKQNLKISLIYSKKVRKIRKRLNCRCEPLHYIPIPIPVYPCHGYGLSAGLKIVTHTRTRCDLYLWPAWVSKPGSITTSPQAQISVWVRRDQFPPSFGH